MTKYKEMGRHGPEIRFDDYRQALVIQLRMLHDIVTGVSVFLKSGSPLSLARGFNATPIQAIQGPQLVEMSSDPGLGQDSRRPLVLRKDIEGFRIDILGL